MYNILVCDDDKEIVNAIEIYLEKEGYKIYKAYNGKEALDIINKVDVKNLDITIGANENKNEFRKDEVKEFGDLEALLQNAPSKEQNMFKIPKVIN